MTEKDMRPFITDGPIGWEVARLLESLSVKPASHGEAEVALARALGHERRTVNDLLEALKSLTAIIGEAWPSLVITPPMKAALQAIAKAEGVETFGDGTPGLERAEERAGKRAGTAKA